LTIASRFRLGRDHSRDPKSELREKANKSPRMERTSMINILAVRSRGFDTIFTNISIVIGATAK